jgi:hypothetical protein
MAWIESHQHLDKNGKLLELANSLQINKYQAIGHLNALWWWALDNAEDGDISRFSSVTVTQACGWSEYIKDEIDLSRINEVTNRNKAEDFVPALIKCGFLDQEKDGLWIHNWSEYTERYFKSIKANKRIREQTKKRVERFRSCNASVTQKKRSVTVPTVPDLTVPNHTEPKEETNTLAQAPKRKPFEIPTAQEVLAYAKEQGFVLDAEKFLNHYGASGWMRGKTKITNWKLCANTWKNNGGSNVPRTSSNVRLEQTDPERTKAYET